MMEIGTILPVGEIPQDPPISLPEDIDSNWAPLEKAPETFGPCIAPADISRPKMNAI
jgi:hypothetical protein